MVIAYAGAAVAGIAVLVLLSNFRVITQYERGVVFRFGRVRDEIRRPGLIWLVPVADRLQKVNMQIITMPVPGAGRHHPGQRHRPGGRGDLLPGR